MERFAKGYQGFFADVLAIEKLSKQSKR